MTCFLMCGDVWWVSDDHLAWTRRCQASRPWPSHPQLGCLWIIGSVNICMLLLFTTDICCMLLLQFNQLLQFFFWSSFLKENNESGEVVVESTSPIFSVSLRWRTSGFGPWSLAWRRTTKIRSVNLTNLRPKKIQLTGWPQATKKKVPQSYC